jgi:hypothetical protein
MTKARVRTCWIIMTSYSVNLCSRCNLFLCDTVWLGMRLPAFQRNMNMSSKWRCVGFDIQDSTMLQLKTHKLNTRDIFLSLIAVQVPFHVLRLRTCVIGACEWITFRLAGYCLNVISKSLKYLSAGEFMNEFHPSCKVCEQRMLIRISKPLN